MHTSERRATGMNERVAARGSAALVVAALVAACGPSAKLPPPPRRVGVAVPPTSTSSAPSAAPLPDPRATELERLVAERDALSDPARTYSRLVQKKPPRRYAVPSTGPFPAPGRAAKVVLYAFGRADVAGCGSSTNEPFRPDGTLCGDVVAPGVEVQGDERARIEALVPAAEAALAAQKKTGHYAHRPIVRCGFDAHHAVAFYDAQGNAIAKLLVCFTCGEWIVAPSSEATGGVSPGLMTADERKTLAEIFDAHGLAAWASDGPLADEVRAYERATYGTEQEPTARGLAKRAERLAPGSGVPGDRAMRALSEDDRRKLCGWVAKEVRPTGEPTRERGYECLDGARWRSQAGDPGCAKTEIRCDAKVSEVEACLRVFREPDHLCAPPAEVPAACKGLTGCLPGLMRLP